MTGRKKVKKEANKEQMNKKKEGKKKDMQVRKNWNNCTKWFRREEKLRKKRRHNGDNHCTRLNDEAGLKFTVFTISQ